MQNENIDAAYSKVPCGMKERFGKGRLPTNTIFESVPYSGRAVGIGTSCYIYITGVTEKIRKQIRILEVRFW